MTEPGAIENTPEEAGSAWLWGLFLSAIWIVATGGLAAYVGFDARGLAILLVAVLVSIPVGLIWTIVIALRLARVAREDRRQVRIALDMVAAQNASDGTEEALKLLQRRQIEIASIVKRVESAVSILTSSRVTQAALGDPAVESSAQGALALETPEAEEELDLGDMIRALNFPVTAEDEEGFTALRKALRHRATGQLVQAAQDILTLFSQEHIYMDDLSPDLARPEVWRRFARGDRGRAVAPLGGIRDRSALAKTSARMKQDTIFRDASHHFLRVFDRTFSDFESRADDAAITAFAGTRTSRAFMLLGRVAGTFD
ncbi:MAG: hypothetical protein P8Q92_10285 [Pseudoprimorskyibacter sp.]|nr:hypothetical protein [Pseudoprimorskyibacter sp.]